MFLLGSLKMANYYSNPRNSQDNPVQKVTGIPDYDPNDTFEDINTDSPPLSYRVEATVPYSMSPNMNGAYSGVPSVQSTCDPMISGFDHCSIEPQQEVCNVNEPYLQYNHGFYHNYGDYVPEVLTGYNNNEFNSGDQTIPLFNGSSADQVNPVFTYDTPVQHATYHERGEADKNYENWNTQGPSNYSQMEINNGNFPMQQVIAYPNHGEHSEEIIRLQPQPIEVKRLDPPKRYNTSKATPAKSIRQSPKRAASSRAKALDFSDHQVPERLCVRSQDSVKKEKSRQAVQKCRDRMKQFLQDAPAQIEKKKEWRNELEKCCEEAEKILASLRAIDNSPNTSSFYPDEFY